MNNQDIQLATKLLKLTIENKIIWNIAECPQNLIDGTNFIIPIYFQAEYNKQIFATYKIRYQNYSPDFDTMYWTEEIKLAIIDKDHEVVIWENNQPISAINNLFSYVQEQASGINNIINNLV